MWPRDVGGPGGGAPTAAGAVVVVEAEPAGQLALFTKTRHRNLYIHVCKHKQRLPRQRNRREWPKENNFNNLCKHKFSQDLVRVCVCVCVCNYSAKTDPTVCINIYYVFDCSGQRQWPPPDYDSWPHLPLHGAHKSQLRAALRQPAAILDCN